MAVIHITQRSRGRHTTISGFAFGGAGWVASVAVVTTTFGRGVVQRRNGDAGRASIFANERRLRRPLQRSVLDK